MLTCGHRAKRARAPPPPTSKRCSPPLPSTVTVLSLSAHLPAAPRGRGHDGPPPERERRRVELLRDDGGKGELNQPTLIRRHRQGVRPSLLVAPTCRAAEAGGSGQDRLLVSMPMRVGVNDEKATENGQQASWSSDGERKGDAQVPQARPAHPHHGRRWPSPLSLLRAAISPRSRRNISAG